MENNEVIATTVLSGLAEYTSALDTLCGLATHELSIFEQDFLNIGFESVARQESLRVFLLANPRNQLKLLAKDTLPLSQYCPRLMLLLRQFGHNMFIYQLPKHMQNFSQPFAVVDSAHSVHRPHFDTMRGSLALGDAAKACQLKSRFEELWNASQPSSLTSTFIL